MEKILKRSAQAAGVAKRRAAKTQKWVEKSQEREARIGKERARRASSQLIVEERKRRREEWERGPLAPRWDAGHRKTTYGLLPPELSYPAPESKKRRPEWFHIAVADRVVVMSGSAKGRIAQVLDVDKETCHVTLKGIDANIHLPEMYRELGDNREIIARLLPIHIDKVRLVYPLPDPITRVPTDTIIERCIPTGQEKERGKKELTKGYRVIPGTDTIIPWPEESEEGFDTFAIDTTIDMVDEETFVPSLLAAPMPLQLIDELRNKYSKFRTRFSYEEQEKFQAKVDIEERRKGLIKTMRTPLQELAALRAQQKEARQQDLTPAQMSVIGALMAQSSTAQKAIMKAKAAEARKATKAKQSA